MCTAATYQTKNFYMGRTLDYEFSYGDEVTITPPQLSVSFPSCRDFKLPLCHDWHGSCSTRQWC